MKFNLVRVLCMVFMLTTSWLASSEAFFSQPTMPSLSYSGVMIPLVTVSVLNSMGFSYAQKNKNDPKGGHDTNKRESNREKHEKGDARRRADQERSNNPNKRRKG
jgi:hypothetical protein